MRRRILHGDVGDNNFEHISSSSYGGLNEPLLKHDSYNNSNSFDDDGYDDHVHESKRAADLLWTNLFSGLIAQWVQWLANILVGTGTWVGGFLFRSLPSSQENNEKVAFHLSPLERERLSNLQQRLEVPFDGTRTEHQMALKELWHVAFPDVALHNLVSNQWKEMGWQGSDPSTDFRGAGFISLENFLFYAKHYPKSFQKLLHKQEGNRATWEYPFAVAGINISFVLVQMLDLRSVTPTSHLGVKFVKLLAEDEMAFDMLYCVAFEILDSLWLAMHASYMEFNEVMKSTRAQIERELALEDVNCVQDMQSYKLLIQ